jgi:hypothetical protein
MARKVAHSIEKGRVILPFITRRMLAAAAFVAASMAVHAQASKPVIEQARFSKKVQLEHPAAIPANVLNLLLRSKEGKEGMARATDAQKQTPAQMFRVSEIHLRAADETDLVVEGISPMASGDHEWFWIVRPDGKKPNIVLFAGGSSLEVQDSRTNSYRDINSVWSSPKETLVSIYKFDGRKYTFRKVVSRKKR